MNREATPKMRLQCPMPKLDFDVITLGHGSGGLLTNQLLEAGVFDLLKNDLLDEHLDGARFTLNGPLAFSTDSYVISPVFFPGGNIGELAVNGTVNDLAMCGAVPRYLSLAFILEEGLPMTEFWDILVSIRSAAETAGVQIVTGDTKVVERGKGDRIFINTSGIGQVHPQARLGLPFVKAGDKIVVSGPVATHGIAILSVRQGLEFEADITSDTRALNHCVIELLDRFGPSIRLLRDPTRGGVATVLNEIARDTRTGTEWRFRAPIVIDCSGTAIIGLLAGARTMFGHESASEYGEPLAPAEHLDEHHGHTLMFRTRDNGTPTSFPEVPWAQAIAKDYANLSGQLVEPGVDNGPGPAAGRFRTPDPEVRRRMLVPASHFWEYGQWLDPYTHGEEIRDHLLCAIYGTFANVKSVEPQTYANLTLDFVAYVAAQGEFRRYLGDYVLTENDIRDHREFDDGVITNSGPFCLHYPIDETYDFRLRDWKWDTRDGLPFEVPFRCLYSADIDNLLVAGKHISVTHIAGSATKFMGNGGQHAIAAAAAASICLRESISPRDVGAEHIDELRSVVEKLTAGSDFPSESTQS